MTIIDQLNAELYPEARIYWRPGQGWASKLWAKLWSLGWRSKRSPAGFRIVVDPEGAQINTGHLSRPYMLAFVGRLMR